MDIYKVFEDKLASTVKGLPTDRVIELIDYAEYLKGKENWKKRFCAFLHRIENKLDNISEKDIYQEIKEARAIHGRKSQKT